MGLFSGFTSTAKATENLTEIAKDGVKGGIDLLNNAFYTDQEKTKDGLQAASKLMDYHIEVSKIQASENSVRSITRRQLALIFTVPYMAAFVLCCALYKLDREWADYIKNTAAEFGLGKIVLSIVICYFGYYGIKSIVGKWKGKE